MKAVARLGMCVCVAIASLGPGTLVAQSPLAMDIAGGPNLPAGNASRISHRSVAVSVGLTHSLSSRVSLTTDVEAAGLDGESLANGANSTDISFLRWSLGAEYEFSRPGSSWIGLARMGIGYSSVVTDFIIDPTHPPRGFAKINDDVFSLYVGLQAGHSFGSVTPFLRVQPEIYFTGSNLRELQALDDELGDSGSLIGVPLQLGVRFHL